MKYQNEYQGSKSELRQILEEAVEGIASEQLEVEGQIVNIPDVEDLDIKVKYSVEEEGGSVTLKVSWDNVVEEEVAED